MDEIESFIIENGIDRIVSMLFSNVQVPVNKDGGYELFLSTLKLINRLPRIFSFSKDKQIIYLYLIRKHISSISLDGLHQIRYYCERYIDSFSNPVFAKALLCDSCYLLFEEIPESVCRPCFNTFGWDPTSYLCETSETDLLQSLSEETQKDSISIPPVIHQHITVVNSFLSDSTLRWLNDPNRSQLFRVELEAILTALNANVGIPSFFPVVCTHSSDSFCIAFDSRSVFRSFSFRFLVYFFFSPSI